MPYLSLAPLALLQRWRTHCTLVRTRRALLSLSPQQLRDVGLSEAQALREAWRPIWDTDSGAAVAQRHDDCSGEDNAQYSVWRPS